MVRSVTEAVRGREITVATHGELLCGCITPEQIEEE
jgi:hypothetical protein